MSVVDRVSSFCQATYDLFYSDGPVEGIGLLPDKTYIYFMFVTEDDNDNGLHRVFAITSISAEDARAIWVHEAESYPGQIFEPVSSLVRARVGEVTGRAECWRIVGSWNLVGETFVASLSEAESQRLTTMMRSTEPSDFDSIPAIKDLMNAMKLSN